VSTIDMLDGNRGC